LPELADPQFPLGTGHLSHLNYIYQQQITRNRGQAMTQPRSSIVSLQEIFAITASSAVRARLFSVATTGIPAPALIAANPGCRGG